MERWYLAPLVRLVSTGPQQWAEAPAVPASGTRVAIGARALLYARWQRALGSIHDKSAPRITTVRAVGDRLSLVRVRADAAAHASLSADPSIIALGDPDDRQFMARARAIDGARWPRFLADGAADGPDLIRKVRDYYLGLQAAERITDRPSGGRISGLSFPPFRRHVSDDFRRAQLGLLKGEAPHRVGTPRQKAWWLDSVFDRFSVSVTDDFNRANSTNLGTDWAEDNGDWSISSNGLAQATATGAWYKCRWTGTAMAGTDVIVQVSGQTPDNTSGFGPMTRGAVSSTITGYGMTGFGADSFYLVEIASSSSDTILDTGSSCSSATTYTLRLESNGTTHEGYLGGVLDVSASDATYTGAGVGIWAYGNVDIYDNWSANDIETGIAITPPQGNLTLSAVAPSLDTNITAPQGSLALSTTAPSAGVGFSIIAAAASLVLSTVAPTVLQEHLAYPARADLTLSSSAPTVNSGGSVDTAITIEAGQLVLSAERPALGITAVSLSGWQVSSTTDASSYASSSSTPANGLLYLAGVVNSHATSPATPTLSGGGMTWVQVATQTITSTHRVTLFRALVLSGATTGALTVDFAGATQTGCRLRVIEVNNAEDSGTNGDNAILQSASGEQAAGAGLTVTFSATWRANSAGVAVIGRDANTAVVPLTGWTELTDTGHATPGTRIATQWRADATTTFGVTDTSNTRGGVGVEIQNKANGGSKSLVPVVRQLVLSTSAPTLEIGGGVSISPARADLVLSSTAPTVDVAGANHAPAPAAANLALSTVAPTVGRGVWPAAADLALRPAGRALEFYGQGNAAKVDKVKVLIGEPSNAGNVGQGDFTIECWIRPNTTQSTEDTVTAGANLSWINGSIFIDRDLLGSVGAGGDWGASLDGSGRVAFGLENASASQRTIVGTTDLRDNAWHHVAITRQRSSGDMAVYVDGAREAFQAAGPSGDVHYDDSLTPGSNTENPYLCFGGEKHDIAWAGQYAGGMDEIRVSDVLRYTGTTYTVPTVPFVADADTMLLYHCDRAGSTTLIDDSGNGLNATLYVGGLYGGPTYALSGVDLRNAPTVTQAHLAYPAAANLVLSSTAPTIGGALSITPDAGALVLSATAPTVLQAHLSYPAAGALALSTAAPVVDIGLVPSAGNLSLSTVAPSVLQEHLAYPASGALTLSTTAPSLTGATEITPDQGTLTLSTTAPTVLQAHMAYPAQGALTLSTTAPTIGGALSISPDTAALTLSSTAPAVEQAHLTYPSQGALTLSTVAPTVLQAHLAYPASGALVLSSVAPSITSAGEIVPDAGALTLSTTAPAALQAHLAYPAGASLTLSSTAPTVASGLAITPTQGSLTLSTTAPTSLQAHLAYPTTGNLALSATAPSLNTGLSPARADLALSTAAPSLDTGIAPTAGALTLSSTAPSVAAPVSITVTAGNLALSSEAPSRVVASGSHVSAPGRVKLKSRVVSTVASRYRPLRLIARDTTTTI